MKKILLLVTSIFIFSNLINAQAGQLDPSFGTNGIVKTDLGEANAVGTPAAKQILLLPDGTMYILQQGLSKRHADGSIDSSFGVNGFVANLRGFVEQMAIGQDGKIIIIAQDSSDFIYRYNTDGTLDSTFSNVGRQQTEIDEFHAVAVQKDGKIVITGFKRNEGYNGVYLLKRYKADGSLDNTFDGKAAADFFVLFIPNSIAIQKDGKIVVAGTNSHNYNSSDVALIRYNINGSLDKTFNRAGVQITDFGTKYDDANVVAIQSDGKIVVTGTLILGRYNIDGSLDNSFSGDGKQTTHFTGYNTRSLDFQPDGKIVVGQADGTFTRFNTDGSIDSSFHQTSNFYINSSIAIRPDGKIVTAGSSSNSYLALGRLNADGSPDITFHGDGTYTEETLSGNSGYKSIAVQKDGKIVAAGSKWNGKNFDFAVSRYNTGGTPDNTFSGDGIQTTDFTYNNDYAKAMAIQKDGKIIVASVNALARYNTDGSLDNTFSGDGKLLTNSIDINQVAIQDDGKIVVAGGQKCKDEYNSDITCPAVARYNTDGSLDVTFGVGGKQMVRVSNYISVFDGSASSIVIQNDQKIVIAGNFVKIVYGERGEDYTLDSIVLVRFNTNGSLDTTYNHNRKKFFTGGYAHAGSCAITKQNDEKIVIAGTFDYKFFVGRVNVDGSTDSSFKGISYDAQEPSYNVTSIALQSDGKIVVAGDSLYRFNTDGRFDSTFNSNGRQSSSYFIKDMVIANNKLYAAGGDRYGTVARYLLDGNNTPPIVSITTPSNNATYLAPAAHIKLSAAATDKDGTISKVEFYNGATLLHTEYVTPYGFVWKNVPLGNYTLTAKATDNSGLVTTSAPIHISVVPNKPPIVSIIKPVNNQSFAAPGYIHLEADAKDVDGRIARVEFYNGSTLLRTEYKYPYTYVWKDVPGGTYTITAVATDNWGAQTTSAPVTVRVTSPNTPIVSSRPIDNKTGIIGIMDMKLAPNPATNAVNIYMRGLRQNKPVTISVISVSGIVMKTMQINNSIQTIQLDVSSLASGVYTIKLTSGDKMTYKQFVKL